MHLLKLFEILFVFFLSYELFISYLTISFMIYDEGSEWQIWIGIVLLIGAIFFWFYDKWWWKKQKRDD
ncbi:MAG: hypothetical protein CL869_00500 [Cytophagia bacterium]|nr:hypothetical protein [Cytophagia bacterium]